MRIVGLQKLTLLDYPGKVACTVFLGGCNFRCPFCHNGELLDADIEPIMETEELIGFLSNRKGILDGVCITGGEPTLQPDLPQLLSKIKDLGLHIKLDTNGYRPDVLRALVEAGFVDYVAMDVKNGPSCYGATVGIPQLKLDKMEESIRFLLSGSVDYELRTTVVQELHSEDSIREMGQWLSVLDPMRKPAKLFLQSFVDRETVLQQGLHAHQPETLEKFIEILTPYVGQIALRGV